MALVIANQTLTGSEVAYTIPADTHTLYLKAKTGDLTVATETGGDTWTLEKAVGENIKLQDPNLGGDILYFDGTGTVQIMYITSTY